MWFFKLSFYLFSVILVIHSVASSQIDSNDFKKGVLQFANDLYEQCVKSKPGNAIISPMSVAHALALLSQASGGRTFEELRNGLHLDGNNTAVADQFVAFNEQLKKSTGNATLSIVNQIYVKDDYQLQKQFQETATTKFDSGVVSMNFDDTDKSAETINHFVEEKTFGKIQNLVKPSMLTNTIVYLVNAIYFKGNWEIPFDPESTDKEEFYISETESVPVDFMSATADFNHKHIAELEASVLEMKYANSNLSFVIVLPDERTGLLNVEEKLKNYDLANIISQMDAHEVSVSIPKFKIEYKIELNDILKNMGIGTIFEDSADFSGLLEKSDEHLKVSKVIHKAFIEINEEGSEAAAASGAGLMMRMMTTNFYANHPFLFFIQDSETNSIIFSGRIEKFDKN